MSLLELKLKPLAAGALFGAALTSAGVYNPSVIIGQMNFEDFLMLKVFLTATAASALVIPLARHFGFTQVEPRASSSIGIFSSYDANILGGSLLGIGMSLTGACPGTVLPQIATGVRSSVYVGLGGILGAMLFERYVEKNITQGERLTLDGSLGISKQWVLLGYQAACSAIVAGAAYFAPGSSKYLVSPVVGGILVAASQAVNLLLTGNALGVSGAYGSIGHWLTSVLKIENGGVKQDYRSAVFLSGALLGSWVLSRLAAPLPSAAVIDISATRATIGGVLLIFGARLGGGCTSGHGISGMSQFSISSFITVAAMFGGGMTWSYLFN